VDTLLFDSYTHIKHLQTKTWLHLEKGMLIKLYSCGNSFLACSVFGFTMESQCRC